MAKPPSIDPRLDDLAARQVAEFINQEWRDRKKRRRDREKIWAEIDRQIAMTPEVSHKQTAGGGADANKSWMPETELPIQAETLEMLTADSRRLKFPPTGDWFQARAALTTDYLDRYGQAESPIPNDVNNEGSTLAQDNADRIAQAAVSHWHRQYDFRGHWDKVDADAFKYGFGVGRLVKVMARMLSYDATTSANREQRIPVFVPRSAKRVYLDDNESSVMHEGYMVGPNIIQVRVQHYDDLMKAAADGDEDQDAEDGGWRRDAIRALPRPKDDMIWLIELEGDVVVHNSQGADLWRNVIAMIATTGPDGEGSQCELVRFRRRGTEFCSYIISPYHHEDPLSAYATSPLMKGMPIARAAAQSLNRIIESGLLKNQPPIGYNRDDIAFAGSGGPIIFPGAQWQTTDNLNIYDEVGGDPGILLNVYIGLLAQYADVTGVSAPRLGAETKSHTTAFAKDAEITRGTIRTVDYARSCLHGPMTRLLNMEYRMGRQLFSNRSGTMVYVEPWNEFVSLRRDHLPDVVVFKAIGAAAPAEEAATTQRRLAAVQFALQVDATAVQLGREPKIDHGALIEQILREGGWTDVDAVTVGAAPAAGIADGSQVGGIAQLPGVLSAANPGIPGVTQ